MSPGGQFLMSLDTASPAFNAEAAIPLPSDLATLLLLVWHIVIPLVPGMKCAFAGTISAASGGLAMPLSRVRLLIRFAAWCATGRNIYMARLGAAVGALSSAPSIKVMPGAAS